MKYELSLLNKNNDSKTIIYDTSNSTMFDVNENKNLTIDEDLNSPKGLKKVAVSLGLSCNMKCSYCLQSKTSKSKYDEAKVKAVIEQLRNEDLPNCRVEFWGGEPLLYMDEIRAVVAELGEEPGLYSVITNGTKLTLELVQWMMENNFSISLSHDAEGQDIRGMEPLDDPVVVEAIKWILDNKPGHFSINSVITGGNIDTKARREFFANKLGVDKDSLMHGGEGPVYNTSLDLLEPGELHGAIYDDIMNGEGAEYQYYAHKITDVLRSIKNGRPLERVSTMCGIENDDHYKILALNDKPMTCHNYNYEFEINSVHDRDGCSKCLVAQICKGSCPAIPRDSDMFHKNCSISFASNSAILRATLAIMIGDGFEVVNFKPID